MTRKVKNCGSIKQPRRTTKHDQSSVEADVIVDNRDRCVADFLHDCIVPGSNLSVVSAYFTIYAFEAMRGVLENSGHMRFLYGEPTAVDVPDPGGNEGKSFRLNVDGGMVLKQVLAQKPLARACANWIHRQVEIRTINRANFLHGKLYHVEHADKSATLAGSSNFTLRGLGLGTIPNVELNIDLYREEDRTALLSWFDNLWYDEDLTSDAKNEVLTALGRLGQPYSPESVYYKTLFHVFDGWLDRYAKQNSLLVDTHLHDTEIWKALYTFQKEGVTSAINRLLRYNGCIVADSVGLGKTWTALAVIKYFELRNERVLVLCPKRLEDNWVRYTAWASSHNNPFEKDRLNYAVRAHTDLSRYAGLSGQVDLSQFNWGSFDLVVIDESHNFRNEGHDHRDEAGRIIRRSRYNRLLEEVLKGGAETKVLMLSATPVNTSLRDLRNQIYLMTEKHEDAFQEALGISNIQSLFGVAQREFHLWETSLIAGKNLDKSALLERLSGEFLTLLDAVTIARSREHVRRYYPDVTAAIGGFPKRMPPRNLYPETDSEGELSYDDLHRRIGDFQLAVYLPSQYLKDKSSLIVEKAIPHFDQRDREHNLIGMMRVNLLKRLESSIYAFILTMRRMLDRMDDLDCLIKKWRKHGESTDLDLQPYEDEEDEDFIIGKGRSYQLDELDIDKWQQDINKDRIAFEELLQQAKQITVDRDQKLKELKQVLKSKVEEAPLDKDGLPNRKVLVFTTFADTAFYLYDHLEQWVLNELGVHIALVSGGNKNRSTLGITRFENILGCFAPRAQEVDNKNEEIEILIATDCLSEGQNLQDCDLVVNYDIHWNPVRLLQRFGRIDRLGSRNLQVGMVNFWPTDDLDCYLDLKNRVETRMVLADATATGLDDPLNQKNISGDQFREEASMEIAFRDRQLARMREEILDIEEANDSIGLNDLTLDDYIADLLQYIQNNRAKLEAMPLGIHAVVNRDGASKYVNSTNTVSGGAIFCLRHNDHNTVRTPNRLWPYFLVYVQEDGRIRYTFRQAKQCLSLFQTLTAGHSDVLQALEDAFDHETEQGHHMKKYDSMLTGALRNIVYTLKDAEITSLSKNSDALLTEKLPKLNPSEDYTLVTWLVITNTDVFKSND